MRETKDLAGVAIACLMWTCAACAFADEPPHDESKWFRSVRQLTTREMGLDRSGEAYFSPDGKMVCFQAYPAGKSEYQIYVINVDGSGLKMISTGEGATTCSYFHPDGKRVIFASNHLDQRPATPPAEASAAKESGSPATQTAPTHGSPPSATQPTHGASGGPPAAVRGPSYAWSYFPGMDIFEYTLATGQLRRLTDADGYDAECAYSPDGEWIVFSSLRTGAQEIFIMDAEGGRVRQITSKGGQNGGPFFSPDGKRVVYRSDRVGDGNLQIFVNTVEGTDEKAITGHDVLHWCPFWHPSGKWLIYTRADHSGPGRPNYDLYLIRDDGSEQHRVTSDSGFDGLPVFSPDGRYLMWTSRRGGIDSPQVFIADFIGLTPEGELRR